MPRPPARADEAAIAKVWGVSEAQVSSFCEEAAATGRRLQQGTTNLAIRHVVSVRGLAQAQAQVAASAAAVTNGTMANLVAQKLHSGSLFPPKPPAKQPACIVHVTCRNPPPPPLAPDVRRRSPPPSPRPPSPPPPARAPPPPASRDLGIYHFETARPRCGSGASSASNSCWVQQGQDCRLQHGARARRVVGCASMPGSAGQAVW